MSGMSLADYVWGDGKNDFTGFYGTAAGVNNPMLTDSATGKRKLPTQADVDAVEKPEDKIKLLTQMVDVVNIQADASMATGRADTIASMTKSAQDALASLNKVVDGLKTKDGSAADGKADPALKTYQSAISGALSSLRNAMDKIGALTSRTDTDTASQVVSDLATMDDQAGKLATSAGGTWRRSGSSFRSDPTKLVDILV